MHCMDRGTEACGLTAIHTCHRCNKQICQSHTLDLHNNAATGYANAQCTCRACTEEIVATMTEELADLHMKLALAFQQADYWSEHLMPDSTPPLLHS